LIGCCIVLTLESYGQAALESKKIKIGKGVTYLNFPVNSADPVVTARVMLDGKPLDKFTINLAITNPQFWTFLDVSAYQGKTLVVEIEKGPHAPAGASKWLDKVVAGTSYPGQDSVYKEKARPQVHFSSQRGWINDPNGLLYHDGEYHLYFQHNPYGWPWGNMHWGHAVSTDLIHWTQLKEAIFPVIKEGVTNDMAFSGTATVDPNNTAGFRKNGIDPIIAAYTSTGRGEALQLSYDKGRTFMDYEGNPVVKHAGEGRDPKVFWYEPGKHWVMVVWDAGVPKKLSLGQPAMVREHSIYTSPDLKAWTYQSGVAGFFECPDLFELPVEGGTSGETKWVMYDAAGKYMVGEFNGKEFTIEQSFTRYEHGGGYFYAAQTINNAPNGRRIQIGWGRDITHPGMPFNQAMLFPTDLKLKMTVHGYRLCPTPVKEINTLHKGAPQAVENRVVTSGTRVSLSAKPEAPVHIIAEFERGDAPMALNIFGYELRHDNEWVFSNTPLQGSNPREPQLPVIYAPTSNIFKIEAIVDKNILEFYINDGELYYVTAFEGKKTGNIEVLVPGNDAKRKFVLKKLEVHELNSIWPGK
jgi:fructan beta-fructosidase